MTLRGEVAAEDVTLQLHQNTETVVATPDAKKAAAAGILQIPSYEGNRELAELERVTANMAALKAMTVDVSDEVQTKAALVDGVASNVTKTAGRTGGFGGSLVDTQHAAAVRVQKVQRGNSRRKVLRPEAGSAAAMARSRPRQEPTRADTAEMLAEVKRNEERTGASLADPQQTIAPPTQCGTELIAALPHQTEVLQTIDADVTKYDSNLKRVLHSST